LTPIKATPCDGYRVFARSGFDGPRYPKRSNAMLRKLVLVGAVLSLTGTTAIAANEYFVVHKPDSKKCEIVSQKPDGKELIQLGHAHRTKMGAELARRVARACR